MGVSVGRASSRNSISPSFCRGTVGADAHAATARATSEAQKDLMFAPSGTCSVAVRRNATARDPGASLVLRSNATKAVRDQRADSIFNRVSFAAGPPRYSPGAPSLRTTRWQGTTSGRGLWEQALAAARTAVALPAALATAA